MGKSLASVHATGWYFPGALDPGEMIPALPDDNSPYLDAEEMVRLIEEGIAAVEDEANALEPSTQTAVMDIVDKGRSSRRSP